MSVWFLCVCVCVREGSNRQFSGLTPTTLHRGAKVRSVKITHGKIDTYPVALWQRPGQTYLQVRAMAAVDNSVSEWSLATEPWKLAVECTDDQYLNTTLRDPTAWVCVKCPKGASCLGPVVWRDVRALQGWWRVPWSHNNATFEMCPFIDDCLGFQKQGEDARGDDDIGPSHHNNGTITAGVVTEGCLGQLRLVASCLLTLPNDGFVL